MTVQQTFDLDMTAVDKLLHVQEWFTYLSECGFGIEIFQLYQLTDHGIECQTLSKANELDYENAIGYKIVAGRPLPF